MTKHVINPSALESLFAPYEEPTKHRIKSITPGTPAQIINARRPSPITIAQNLRAWVKEWRNNSYPGASETTRELLHHWFFRDHTIKSSDGESNPFKYYFCQREAIETLIYLKECRNIDNLSSLIYEFSGDDSEIESAGISPEEELWTRYAFKIATGAGKTKVMSLAIVWSYFHSLYESNSPMPRHFLAIAPGITVFERLKEDFENGKIFDNDPLIPPAWKGDWNLSVVLQDEVSGANTGGILYLTNIHRLYDLDKRKNNKEDELYKWAGPPVSKSKALDIGESLREKITSHKKIMLLNDEAHHVWDPDSAWNEAILFLNEEVKKKGGDGIFAQLDFSATPKDNKGQLFKHIVCDTPLGEAVDGGIVKTPVIGRGDKLTERASDDASIVYEQHLKIGYERWKASKEEWEKSGKKPLLFIMTESTDAADDIARRLNSDPVFKELNNKTLNLHTNLKVKKKITGKGKNKKIEFIESEKEISDEDLKELRKLSRELDSNSSQYCCIVSVLMLREGWDVRNVTTIVPLRPLTAASKILPEQTLGRGLRRMTPPGSGGANEIVAVVEHPMFVSLYDEQLSQEGLPIEVLDIEDIPKTTITIFVDKEKKDVSNLDLTIPSLTREYTRRKEVEISIEEIKKQFEQYDKLPLGDKGRMEIDYEGRALLTDEIIEKMKIKLELLSSGFGSISYYREYIEKLTGLSGLHQLLAPLLKDFLTDILFEKKVDINDQRLISRLGDSDVREHIFAVFVPILRAKTTKKEKRKIEGGSRSVTSWKPFQVTFSINKPAIEAKNTPFNLVTCNHSFEERFANFLRNADDVVSFCKNAGPQSLKIDYLSSELRTNIYIPDFIVRMKTGEYVLVETKDLHDREQAFKARDGNAWCKSATTEKSKWDYLFVKQTTFANFNSNKLKDLIRTCKPDLVSLLKEAESGQLKLDLDDVQVEQSIGLNHYIDLGIYNKLPELYQRAIRHSVTLFEEAVKKGDQNFSFSHVFTPLIRPLDDSTKALIIDTLLPYIPDSESGRKDFFEPDYYGGKTNLKETADNLKKMLLYRAGKSQIGLLKFCLDYASGRDDGIQGIFLALRDAFKDLSNSKLHNYIKEINNFRKQYVAHQEGAELTDKKKAEAALKIWIDGLVELHKVKSAVRV